MRKEQYIINGHKIQVELAYSYTFGRGFRKFVTKWLDYGHKSWDFKSNFDRETVVWKWYIKKDEKKDNWSLFMYLWEKLNR